MTLRPALATSSSPTISANRAPLLSARRSWALKPAAGEPIAIFTPGTASRRPSTSLEPETSRRVAGRDEERVGGLLGAVRAVRARELDDPLEAEREADGRRVAAAELRDEAVVAAARAHRRLGPELVRDPLEHRARVVVEAAHEPRIQLKRDADVREQLLHALEVRARLRVEIAVEQRRGVDQRAHLRVLAVEDPEWIALETPHAVLVERVAMRARSTPSSTFL